MKKNAALFLAVAVLAGADRVAADGTYASDREMDDFLAQKRQRLGELREQNQAAYEREQEAAARAAAAAEARAAEAAAEARAQATNVEVNVLLLQELAKGQEIRGGAPVMSPSPPPEPELPYVWRGCYESMGFYANSKYPETFNGTAATSSGHRETRPSEDQIIGEFSNWTSGEWRGTPKEVRVNWLSKDKSQESNPDPQVRKLLFSHYTVDLLLQLEPGKKGCLRQAYGKQGSGE